MSIGTCRRIRGNRPLRHQEAPRTAEEKAKEWEFIVKFTLIVQDIFWQSEVAGNGLGRKSHGRNAILGGFQTAYVDRLAPQRRLHRSHSQFQLDWNGKEPSILATENDGLNGTAMLFGKLLTGTANDLCRCSNLLESGSGKACDRCRTCRTAAGGLST